MHYDFSCNGELKRELREKRISYRELADTLHYSIQTLYLWLSRTVTPEQELLIKGAISTIENLKERSSYDEE